MGQGYGFLVIAEGYYNFGLIGVAILMFFIGYLVSRLNMWAEVSKLRYPTVMLIILMNNILWGVRNCAQSIIRPIVWEKLLLVLVSLLFHFLWKSSKTLKVEMANAETQCNR